MYIDPTDCQANTTLPPPINWATKPVLSARYSSQDQQRLAEEPGANTGPLPPDIVQGEIPNDRHNLLHLLRQLSHSDVQQPRPTFTSLDGRDLSSEVQNLTSAFSNLSTSAAPASSGPLAARTTPSARSTISPILAILNCGLAANATAIGTTSTNNNPSNNLRRLLAIRTAPFSETTPSARSMTLPTLSVLNHGLAVNGSAIRMTSTNSNPSRLLAIRTVPSSVSGMSRQVSPAKKKYYGIVVGKSTGIYYDEWEGYPPLSYCSFLLT